MFASTLCVDKGEALHCLKRHAEDERAGLFTGCVGENHLSLFPEMLFLHHRCEQLYDCFRTLLKVKCMCKTCIRVNVCYVTSSLLTESSCIRKQLSILVTVPVYGSSGTIWCRLRTNKRQGLKRQWAAVLRWWRNRTRTGDFTFSLTNSSK